MTRRSAGCILTWAAVLVAAPASADVIRERRLALEPGGTLIVESDAGSVTVTGDSTSGALVVLTSQYDDFDQRFDLQVEEGPGSATVRLKRRAAWLTDLFRSEWWRRSADIRLTVRVPRRTSVNVTTSGGSVETRELTGRTRLHSAGGGLRAERLDGDVDLRTSGGSIAAQQVRGNVAADTSGGGITIADVVGRVRADASGGSVQVDAASGDVHVKTSGGGVRVRGAGGRVEARSSGGSVTVAFAKGNNRGGVLSSSGGGVRAELDPAIDLSIDASAAGGTVTNDLPVTARANTSRRSLRGNLNGGGALLELRSSGGSVRIATLQ